MKQFTLCLEEWLVKWTSQVQLQPHILLFSPQAVMSACSSVYDAPYLMSRVSFNSIVVPLFNSMEVISRAVSNIITVCSSWTCQGKNLALWVVGACICMCMHMHTLFERAVFFWYVDFHIHVRYHYLDLLVLWFHLPCATSKSRVCIVGTLGIKPEVILLIQGWVGGFVYFVNITLMVPPVFTLVLSKVKCGT